MYIQMVAAAPHPDSWFLIRFGLRFRFRFRLRCGFGFGFWFKFSFRRDDDCLSFSPEQLKEQASVSVTSFERNEIYMGNPLQSDSNKGRKSCESCESCESCDSRPSSHCAVMTGVPLRHSAFWAHRSCRIAHTHHAQGEMFEVWSELIVRSSGRVTCQGAGGYDSLATGNTQNWGGFRKQEQGNKVFL